MEETASINISYIRHHEQITAVLICAIYTFYLSFSNPTSLLPHIHVTCSLILAVTAGRGGLGPTSFTVSARFDLPVWRGFCVLLIN